MAMLEKKNERIPFYWEKSFIFMLIVFIVLLVQHGRHEHTLLPLTPGLDASPLKG